jgi:hypothetical protein
MRSALLSESFEFLVNGAVIESDIAEAAALAPAVQEQLSVDGCARKFILDENGIETTDIRSLQVLLSGESIFIKRSQGLLSRMFRNVNLERLFLGCSKADIRKNLSDLVKERRVDLEFADISALSFEALDSLLLSESVSVENEDALLGNVLKLVPGDGDLLRHIQVRLIISEFPDIFTEFRGKHFELLWRGSRDGFEGQEFHRRCDDHANTLTGILDTEGNIFGGFTPVEWESRVLKGNRGFTPVEWESRVWNRRHRDESNLMKADDSLKSFLFDAEKSAQHPGEEICVEDRTKAPSNLLSFRIRPRLWW